MTVMGFHALLIVFSLLHGLNKRRCACVPVQLPSTLMTSQKLFLETITDSSPLWLRRWTATAVVTKHFHFPYFSPFSLSLSLYRFPSFPFPLSTTCFTIHFPLNPISARTSLSSFRNSEPSLITINLRHSHHPIYCSSSSHRTIAPFLSVSPHLTAQSLSIPTF